MTDLRLAFRSLAKSPGFAFVAIATLALCIGANSAIFTVVNSVLLRPFDYPDSERLVYVNNSYPKNDLLKAGVSIPDYFDRMDRAPSIEDGALYNWHNFNLSGEGNPVRVLGLRTTASLFSTLQSQPLLGRTYSEAECEPGQDQVVVLSHSLWQETFGGRDDILGQTIRLGGVPYQVVGVMPEAFSFPAPWVKMWLPLTITPEQRSPQERGNEYSEMIVRLKPGATAEMLSAECAAIVEQNLEFAPQFRGIVEATGFTGIATPLLEETVGEVRPLLWLLQAGVLAALLIGCANVANLLLTRALARERELTIRLALGASRWNIVRQLLAESLVLFLIGGGLGLLVASWGLTGMNFLGIANLPRGHQVTLDHSVFLFTLACAGLTGLVFGLLPALQASRANASDALKSAGARATGGRRQRSVRNALVVVEIALSIMLLATTTLLIRSFNQLEEQATGFDPQGVLTARFTLSDATYNEDEARLQFVEQATERLNALPGVEHVGVTSNIPFGYGNSQATYFVSGQELAPDATPPHGQMRSVSPGFFESMGVTLQRGRLFTPFDNQNAEMVVVVDRVLADKYFPGEDPIGKTIYRRRDNPNAVMQIVGVVSPVKHSGLDDPVSKETVYFPYAQRPVAGLTLTMRTNVPPSTLIADVRRTVLEIDSNMPLYDVRALQDRIEETLLNRRTPMLLLALFAGMALLLAALGVYGVLAFNVGQRTQEIGIRMALGALARDVLRLILRQGLILIGAGAALGVVGYVAISRLLQSMVFEVSPLDPISVAAALVALGTVALVACLLPARRATRVDPMVALRDE